MFCLSVFIRLHPGVCIRNPHFRLRVWIVCSHLGVISEHVRGSPRRKSRGASPPDLPMNIWYGFWIDFFSFLTLRNCGFRGSISYQIIS